MVRAHGLLVLCAAKLVRLLSQVAQEVHAQVAYQLLRLLVDSSRFRQLLHDELLYGRYTPHKTTFTCIINIWSFQFDSERLS